MIFVLNFEFSGTVLKKHTGQVKREKYDWRALTILISPVRNKFIKNGKIRRIYKSLFNGINLKTIQQEA